jgi:hypothetical protein
VARASNYTRKLRRAHLGGPTTPPALRQFYFVSIRPFEQLVLIFQKRKKNIKESEEILDFLM